VPDLSKSINYLPPDLDSGNDYSSLDTLARGHLDSASFQDNNAILNLRGPFDRDSLQVISSIYKGLDLWEHETKLLS
jgi:hypothetical protein